VSPDCALALAYDGTDFAGWQLQPGRRTVQGELEGVLGRFYGRRVRIAGSGRTDAGVHALGQVAAFRPPRPYPSATLSRAIGALLPADVRLLACAEVEAGFDPRRDALRRTYGYHLLTAGSLFHSRYALAVEGDLDWDGMAEAARLFEGRRDFAAVGSPVSPGGGTVREVHRCHIEEGRGCRRLVVTADAFLHRMVRAVVGCLLAVGRGRMTVGDVAGLLESRDRARAPAAAPARGLFLARVDYAHFSYDPDPGPFRCHFGEG
jgi:tRNA pseudouridine38-40 synthase